MINAWVKQGRIWASYRDAVGRLELRDIGPAEYTAFARDPTPWKDEWCVTEIREDHPGWYKLVFADYESRKFQVENNPLLFEGDVSPVRRFLTDRKCKIDPPKRCYIDIETDSRVPFTEAVQGNTTMLSWALVGEDGVKKTTVLEDWDDQAEAELFLELWKAMADYDQVAAYNGERFDFQVINIKSMYFAKRYKKMFGDVFWPNKQRILQVDQLLCFERHHMAAGSGDEKTSHKLDAVCMALFGEGKNDFDSGKTYEAWAAGGAARQELVAYNLQDTELLPKLEAETGYLALQQTIGEVTLCPVNTHTLKPMPWIDAYLLKMAHKRKTHLPTKKRGGDAENEEVEGAIVMAPTKLGVHENVHVCDFKSLYPTIIRTWNIGSETKLTDEEAAQIMATTGLACRNPHGTWFRTDTKSMLSEFCEDMMNMRDHWKKRMTEFPPGSPEAEEAERKSKAYKIANNSGFGVTGNPYFRLYDPAITSSIIQGARLMLETIRNAANAQGMDAIYGDTDSLFVVGETPEGFDAFCKKCNTHEIRKVLAEHHCRKDFCVVELAYEKQFSRLVFPLGQDGKPAAKRYAGAYAHKGWNKKENDWNWANENSKPEIRGLEYMRTDSVARARRMQREAIEMILFKKTGAVEIDEWVKRQRELFLEGDVPLEDIVYSKGISRPLDAYKAKGPHVRIAEALAEAGQDVGEGTRISYVVAKGGSPVQVIEASEYKGEFDRRHYWNKAVYPATMRVLMGAFPKHPWKKWKVGSKVALTQQMFSFF